MMTSSTRLGVLISGRGSNCMAIAKAIREGRLAGCEVAVVIANVAGAAGIEAARALEIPAVMLESKGRARREHEEAVTALLEKFRVDLVCLAGYMRVLSAEFVQRWQGRLLNIHPSLLPAFAGLHAQRQALEYGAQIAGCTVHFVDEAVDGGVIVLQRTCAVLPDDTEGRACGVCRSDRAGDQRNVRGGGTAVRAVEAGIRDERLGLAFPCAVVTCRGSGIGARGRRGRWRGSGSRRRFGRSFRRVAHPARGRARPCRARG
jgi:phosphoribosylglycinamide formyltransferase-1